MPCVCAALGSSDPAGITLTPSCFQRGAAGLAVIGFLQRVEKSNAFVTCLRGRRS
jgi:hypothetical protein